MWYFSLGLNKNQYQDCEGGDRKSYDLPFGQNHLISEILKVNKKPGYRTYHRQCGSNAMDKRSSRYNTKTGTTAPRTVMPSPESFRAL